MYAIRTLTVQRRAARRNSRRQRRPAAATVAVVLLLTTPAVTAQAPATQPAGPVVDVTQIDGQVVTGRIVALTPQVEVAAEGQRLRVPWDQVLAISPQSPQVKAAPDNSEPALLIELADGARLSGSVLAASGDIFTFRTAAGAVCEIDLPLVRRITRPAAGSAGRAAFATEAERAGAAQADVAVVARGERILTLRGRVEEASPAALRFNWNDRSVPLPWPRVVGLLRPDPPERSASCIIELSGQERYAGRIIGGDATRVTITAAYLEQDLTLAWEQIRAINCRSDRVTLLTDLTPLRYEFEPFLDQQWPYAVNETLTGRPIRLGGRQYARGITLHARARLTYRIGGAYRQFAAVVGIVDEMAQRGHAVVRVEGDNQVLWEAEDVRGGQSPRKVLVDITGVQRLTLEVDFGEDLDLSDHVAWGLPRVIR